MAVTRAASKNRNSLLKIYIIISGFTCLVRGICPNHQSCECTSDYINCTCNGVEDTLYISQSTEKFTGKEFIVSKCNRVEVEKLALSRLHLETLKFVELDELDLQSYSLSESSINSILMHNITFLNLQPYSLTDVKYCNNLEIINASIENFPSAAVGGIKAKSIEIKDCHIGTVHSRAFTLANIEKFTFENNYINTFDITSVVIRSAKEFNFIRNAVTSSSFGTLSLAEVENVEVGHSSFRQVHGSMIITKDVKSFSFHDCYVETCESRAFWSVEATDDIIFSNNEIKSAEDDSLIPNLGPSILSDDVRIQVKLNLLTCDCHLAWILTSSSEKLDILKKGSLCYEPEGLKGQSLSNLSMSVDYANNCVDIRVKLKSEIEVYSSESITSTQATLSPKKLTKKPKNTKKPRITKPEFITENSVPTRDAQKQKSFVSAEKQKAGSSSLNINFSHLLLFIVVFVTIYGNFYCR